MARGGRLPEGTPPGRNEPCHCGSGRKYKQCHLEKDEAARRKARAAAQPETPAATAPADAPKPGPPPRPQTQQPWKGPRNTKGFQKLTTPRRSGGS
jgi:SEC-C motif